MGFNSAFKRVKIVKNPGNGRLNNLNDPVLNVLSLNFGMILLFLKSDHFIFLHQSVYDTFLFYDFSFVFVK